MDSEASQSVSLVVVKESVCECSVEIELCNLAICLFCILLNKLFW